jgi:TPR repeat protein
MVGILYLTGSGVAADGQESNYWFQKAADQGIGGPGNYWALQGELFFFKESSTNMFGLQNRRST